ncbi:MAG TPA: OsmC family protein [Thermoflexus sp.]|nr:OsmC family protein [Thermoflexus sp.]
MGTLVNGVDVEELQQLLEEVRTHPEAVQSRRWARFRWEGGLRGRAYVRNQSFTVDESVDRSGREAGISALEYVLGALGACLGLGLVFNASRRGITIRNLEVALEGHIDNLLRFLGLDGEGHPGYREVIAKAYVDADADEETLQALWTETVATSPVGNTFARPVALRAEIATVSGWWFRYTPEEDQTPTESRGGMPC